MSVASVSTHHLNVRSAEDVHELFRLLGYDVYSPYAYEGEELEQLELDEVDEEVVERAYVVAERDNHTVWLYEVSDLRQTRLRGLAWNALQRGVALLVVTKDYRELVLVDPRFVGHAIKSNVRVNKLKVIGGDATRHDVDTLNAIHAHGRTGQEIYDAQAEAFNVERITKRFYNEYRQHFERALEVIRQYNKGVREFHDDDKLHAFTQRLMGRLMFLYFLQRKGWLGGRARFLTEQYKQTAKLHADEYQGDNETFYYYREVLEPLFFETMNTKRPGNITRWSGIHIPYLNGGLFDDARDPKGPIVLPDSLFDPFHASGLLAFFNRYNFTIADDTPLEQDVAVDPEMLGKVFENMLEERERGQTGSFYTPRTIVAYMCQEALAGYLEESAEVPREKTRAQFDPDTEELFTPEEAQRVDKALETLTVLDPAVGSGSFLIGMMQEIIRLRSASAEARGIDVTPAMVAGWKEAIIRDTLYGVDIKPEAIEIAQLRLWLALVVNQTIEQAKPLPNLDYKLMAGDSLIETIDGEPVLGEAAERMIQSGEVGPDGAWELVNPQMNMFKGNEPPTYQSRMLLSDQEKRVHEERIKLSELRDRYFDAEPETRRRLRAEIQAQERNIVFASLAEKAEKLQEQIDELGRKSGLPGGLTRTEKQKLNEAIEKLDRVTRVQEQLRKPDAPLPFFLYRLHFSEVFAQKGGFDIVVANPPYVRMELIKEQKFEFRATYPTVYSGRADLYVYFLAQGYRLLRTGGQLAYITSNKYLRAKYGQGVRQFLNVSMQLKEIIDFGDLPVFDAAAYPCILLAEKLPADGGRVRAVLVRDVEALEKLRHTVATRAVHIKQERLGKEAWKIVDVDLHRVLQQMQDNVETLSTYTDERVFRGIVTGLNDAFIIDGEMYRELVAADSCNVELIKPLIIGRDVKRWEIDAPERYILFTYHGVDIDRYPTVKAHLREYKADLEKRATSSSHEWYELQQPQMGIYPEFDKPKIVYPEFGERPQFAYDMFGRYINNKLFVIPTGDLFLLGVLNSQAVHAFLRTTASQIRGGYIEFRWMTLSRVPIPIVSESLRNRIADIAQRCLETKDVATREHLEEELNALVYQAYGLDQSDIQVIEQYLDADL